MLVIYHTHINDEVPPWYALLGGVVGTVGTKVQLLFGTTKLFWRKRGRCSRGSLRFFSKCHLNLSFPTDNASWSVHLRKHSVGIASSQRVHDVSFTSSFPLHVLRCYTRAPSHDDSVPFLYVVSFFAYQRSSVASPPSASKSSTKRMLASMPAVC